MHPMYEISVNLENFKFWDQSCPKKYDWQTFKKNKHLNGNEHIAIYLRTKYQSVWITSDLGTKFAQKNMNEKNVEKINVKIVIII